MSNKKGRFGSKVRLPFIYSFQNINPNYYYEIQNIHYHQICSTTNLQFSMKISRLIFFFVKKFHKPSSQFASEPTNDG